MTQTTPENDAFAADLLERLQGLWDLRCRKLRALERFANAEREANDDCYRFMVDELRAQYKTATECYDYWLGYVYDQGFRFDADRIVARDPDGVRLVWDAECSRLLAAVGLSPRPHTEEVTG